ncbi:MAG: GNAT family N-acetyltransferase [Oscillospiraceae bacterium]|nr:GNAT family N-acetyltransferase [Oscillospiraceae bacterium]
MNIKELNIDECELFKLIDRSENVRAAWQTDENDAGSLDFNYLDITGYGSHTTTCIKILQNVITQGGGVYGAFENNHIVGIASVLPVKAERFSVLTSVDVSAGYRKKGIGRILVDNCAEYSKSMECLTMLAAANPFETTIKFLKSYGFLYTQNPQNKLLIKEDMIFPKFDFPPPFGGNVEQPIYLELPLNEYEDKNYFYDRTTLEEITRHNCYGATRLTVTDKQSFMFGLNPVYFMATYKYEFGENHKILLACFDTFPVGFMGYGENGDGKSVFIEPMMVDSAFQRKGIATKMLELFEEKIRSENKYEAISLGNRTDNIAAGNTYKKSGFVLTEVDGLSSYRRKIL